MVGIRHSVVTKIVRNGPHNDRNRVEFVQLSPLMQASFSQENEGHLEHISRVDIVMVLHISSVALVNLANKARNLHLVKLGQFFEAKLAHKVDCQNRETLLAANFFAKANCVEINLFSPLEIFRVIVNEIKHRGERRGSTDPTDRV